MAIYLDHAATTPLRPEVREAMLPYLDGVFGNPSSIHQYGREARNGLDRAREQVARAIGADPSRVYFTSGGTEADNLAIVGGATARLREGKNHVITTRIEHHAVLDACRHLERIGFDVTYLPVDRTGRVDPDELKRAVTDRTGLISVMYGNNETGTLQPVREIGEWARQRGILFHTDAVQALGMEELDVSGLPVDLLTVSGHKINGPKGAGALYIAPKAKIFPRAFGGQQERKIRPGTENVAGIVGFGKAAELATIEREEHRRHCLALRNTLLNELRRLNVPFVINGNPEHFLPHILNLGFPGADAETMLMNLDLEGVACSSGSACTSGTLQVSHVLDAMGVEEEILRSSLRFSFGYGNTEGQMKEAASLIARILQTVGQSG
ncbi:cysteine desulfurase family protein [Staphylospora marina]|uniref:cysteine desulfurase family protein n=1 Tax=Staphylospora marina TaxID=2490858 RepID=UPI0030B94281